jgi:hypothetical protein
MIGQHCDTDVLWLEGEDWAGGTGAEPEAEFHPKDLPDCFCWYPQSYIETLGDGVLVATWEDGSTNARHASQASAPLQPVVSGAVQNGKSAVNVDGTDDRLDLSVESTVAGNSWTFYFVGHPDAGVRCAVLATNGSLPEGPLVFGVSRTLVSWRTQADGWQHIGVSDTDWRVVAVVLEDGVGGEAWVDGSSVGTGAYSAPQDFKSPAHLFTSGGAADPFRGLVGATGLFTTAHDATQRGQVEGYLTELFGL